MSLWLRGLGHGTDTGGSRLPGSGIRAAAPPDHEPLIAALTCAGSAGEVQDAEGIDAVRAALTRLFERLILHVPGSNWFRHDDIKPSIRAGSLEGVMHIELVVRETAVIEGEGISPVIRREPLQQAENNQRRSSVPS